MSFNPDASPTYQKFLASRANYSEPDSHEYVEHWIRFMCSGADAASSTCNATMTSNADSNVKTSVKVKQNDLLRQPHEQ